MIFASLDPDAPDLETWLGDFAFCLDFCIGQSEAGMDFHCPRQWRVEANWEIDAGNPPLSASGKTD